MKNIIRASVMMVFIPFLSVSQVLTPPTQAPDDIINGAFKKEHNQQKQEAYEYPDINEKDISEINELILKYKVEGIIISNTTDGNREKLTDVKKNEKGGLSGFPIKNLSTSLIKKFYKDVKGKVHIIGVGGVDSGESAFEKISAGANAVQLYTGMIYKGPGIVREIKKDLIKILKKEKIKNINEAIGINS